MMMIVFSVNINLSAWCDIPEDSYLQKQNHIEPFWGGGRIKMAANLLSSTNKIRGFIVTNNKL
jgi:hypothetical protein